MSQRPEETPIDAAIERALAGVPRPAARPEFKERLRAQFLAAARSARATDAALDAAPDPTASDVFHTSKATMSAAVSSASDAASDPASPATVWDSATQTLRPGAQIGGAGAARAHTPAPVRTRTSPRVPWGAYLAAAGLVGVTLAVFWPRKQLWTVLEGPLLSGASVDERPIASGERDRLARVLDGDDHVVYSGLNPVRFLFDDMLVVELAAETRVRLLAFDDDAAGEMLIDTLAGSVRVCTLPRFSGSHLRVKTAEFEAEVTGTSFAVDIVARGSCLCCLTGEVQLESGHVAEYGRTVKAGSMCLVFDGPTDPMWDEVREQHVAPVRALELVAQDLARDLQR